MKTRCVFITFLLVLTFECIPSNDLRDIDDIIQERPCTDAGGRCVYAKDCPEKIDIMTRGQCPNQAYKNVDCCFGTNQSQGEKLTYFLQISPLLFLLTYRIFH